MSSQHRLQLCFLHAKVHLLAKFASIGAVFQLQEVGAQLLEGRVIDFLVPVDNTRLNLVEELLLVSERHFAVH